MVKIVNRDIFADNFQEPISAIIHQANCRNMMGAGIAFLLKQRWLEVYAADCDANRLGLNQLGNYSVARIKDAVLPVKYVFNLYSQDFYGRYKRQTSYEAMLVGLEQIRDDIHKGILPYLFPERRIGIPYGMGCGLGGGNWKIVEAIIRNVFEYDPTEILICKI